MVMLFKPSVWTNYAGSPVVAKPPKKQIWIGMQAVEADSL